MATKYTHLKSSFYSPLPVITEEITKETPSQSWTSETLMWASIKLSTRRSYEWGIRKWEEWVEGQSLVFESFVQFLVNARNEDVPYS